MSNYFSVRSATALKELPSGAKIYVMGVCGVAMAQLAVALAEQGYQVSGSDKRFYEPMGSFLRSSSVKLYEGYSADNIPEDVDLVVIGNAIPYDFDETRAVEERRLPYTFFPKLLNEVLIRDKHSVVVCGTHGKSTTSALIADLFVRLDQKPSYFIGGAVPSLPRSLWIDSGEHCVIEGDEYDSAFFAKAPKFNFYRPDTCIINAIEFDHADIYPDLEAVKVVFSELLISLNSDARLIACIDFPVVRELLAELKPKLKCSVYTFGENSNSDFCIKERKITQNGQKFLVESSEGGAAKKGDILATPLLGAFNARNVTATFITAKLSGFSSELISQKLAQFEPVKRRQECRFRGKTVNFIEDFAHHPTAVKGAINALKEAYPEQKLLAIFEPRSATSRKAVFQDEYTKALSGADEIILRSIDRANSISPSEEQLDVEKISAFLNGEKRVTHVFDSGEEILKNLSERDLSGYLILVMSNGGFDDLPAKLTAHLKEHYEE